MWDHLSTKALKQTVKNYNLHVLINRYSTMKRPELLQVLEDHLVLAQDPQTQELYFTMRPDDAEVYRTPYSKGDYSKVRVATEKQLASLARGRATRANNVANRRAGLGPAPRVVKPRVNRIGMGERSNLPWDD